MKTESGDFSFKISGKLQWDIVDYDGLYGQESLAAAEKRDGRMSYIRRGQVRFSGKAYDDWKYSLKLKSSGSEVELDDAYIAYTAFKPVTVMVGRWDLDFGLEDSISSS